MSQNKLFASYRCSSAIHARERGLGLRCFNFLRRFHSLQGLVGKIAYLSQPGFAPNAHFATICCVTLLERIGRLVQSTDPPAVLSLHPHLPEPASRVLSMHVARSKRTRDDQSS